MTAFDPEGRVAEWGRGDVGRIYRLGYALDDLVSRASAKGLDHHRRWNMRRAAARIRDKIRNLVDDLHRKLAKWLCEEHRFILLPKFETSRMVRCGRRKITRKTVRAMLTWSHYRFRQRLLAKAREYPGCHVVLVDEAYTSKTCGRCGRINDKLGGNKWFRCPSCGLECDRDLHAARNILLRFLSDVPALGSICVEADLLTTLSSSSARSCAQVTVPLVV
jgi:putative transposase